MILDENVPRSTSSGVYISELIRFATVSGHMTNFYARYKIVTAKLLQQSYRYHKGRATRFTFAMCPLKTSSFGNN